MASENFQNPGRWGRSGDDSNPRHDIRGEGFDRRGGWRRGSDYYGTYSSGPKWYSRRDRYSRSGIREPLSSSARENPRSSPWRDADQRGSQQAEYRGGRSGILADETGDKSHRGRGPKGYRRSDVRIREDVCERLMDDDRIDASEIEVCVEDCVVTLSGSVSSRDEKRRAEDVIAELRGVSDVHNELRVAQATGWQHTS